MDCWGEGVRCCKSQDTEEEALWCVDGDSHFKRLRLEWAIFDKPEQQEEKLTSSTTGHIGGG